jgi:F-type H+-transporting ATPase subunit gamma
MPSLKELNEKIASLKNTQKMTRTMKLVAASKMRRAQQAQVNAADYAEELRRMLSGVAASVTGLDHPLLTPRDPAEKVMVLLYMSDRGLCGGFNNNLCRYMTNWVAEREAEEQVVSMSFCGRRGYTFFRRRCEVVQNYEGVTDRPRYESAAEIGTGLMQAYTAGATDRVYLAYNRFRSALSQVPVVEQLLPVEQPAEDNAPADPLFEPEVSRLLERLLPDAIRFRVFHAMVENAAGEHAARMAAMDSATNNAGDLIDHYTLERNQARQAAITTELIEIVTGAESL